MKFLLVYRDKMNLQKYSPEYNCVFVEKFSVRPRKKYYFPNNVKIGYKLVKKKKVLPPVSVLTFFG